MGAETGGSVWTKPDLGSPVLKAALLELEAPGMKGKKEAAAEAGSEALESPGMGLKEDGFPSGTASEVEGYRPAPAAKMAVLHTWRASGGTKKTSL